ncbi:hypothetical protein EFD56_27985 [Rhizobium phaseoli]|uniref:ThiF family adenylyltransferase n=1 Tax=Rhizobium phaseoli TaxID=396 RepID=UPI000F89350A|nr:ThiF family adenylyltransferase [Rhizobium phaseoli]RUM13497.1 hypothetical protein EFD56_27985 [Rhizobium phaseoli]
MTDFDLGDRHHRAVSGLGAHAEPKTVKIRAGLVDDDLPRQHLLVCLVNLLVRLHGSVESVQLEVDGNIAVAMPHMAPPCDALHAMDNLATWANGGRIPVRVATGPADITIDIGSEPAADADLYAFGAGWKAWVGRAPASLAQDDAAPGCLGPYFAASMVAAEVFKISRGLLKGRFATDDAYSLWDVCSGRWDELADGPPLRDLTLPSLYLIGAGAVGQGFIQVLGASQIPGGFLVTIDHDHHDAEGTNLNRCFLAGVEDVLHPKVDAVKRYRNLTALAGYEFPGSLTDYLMSEKVGLPNDLVSSERQSAYDIVVSAVDINSSRLDIQGVLPGLVIGGSTDGLRAQSALYGIVPGSECLGCWNAAEDEKLKAIAIEAELREMTVDHQRERLTGIVDDVEAALAYLATPKPRCGQLGESEVRAFATAVSPEFSVSFVSLAAAVMTAAKLFAVMNDREVIRSRPAKAIFVFRNLECVETTTARRPTCPYCMPSLRP